MTLQNKENSFRLVRERTEEQVNQFVCELAKVFRNNSAKIACYIHGLGGQPAGFYKLLKKEHKADLLWWGIHQQNSLIKLFLKPFLMLMPCYGGIIRIHAGDEIISLFPSVLEQGMAGIYMFDLSRADEIAKIISKTPSELPNFAEIDPTHFIYLIDEDQSAGVVEIIKYGIQCPIPLKEMIVGET